MSSHQEKKISAGDKQHIQGVKTHVYGNKDETDIDSYSPVQLDELSDNQTIKSEPLKNTELPLRQPRRLGSLNYGSMAETIQGANSNASATPSSSGSGGFQVKLHPIQEVQEVSVFEESKDQTVSQKPVSVDV